MPNETSVWPPNREMSTRRIGGARNQYLAGHVEVAAFQIDRAVMPQRQLELQDCVRHRVIDRERAVTSIHRIMKPQREIDPALVAMEPNTSDISTVGSSQFDRRNATMPVFGDGCGGLPKIDHGRRDADLRWRGPESRASMRCPELTV